MTSSKKTPFKTLWVLLLDRSGSMGESFSARAELAGYPKTGDYETKMQAAKDVTLSELESFGQLFTQDEEVEVGLFAFNSESEFLFKCLANESYKYRTVVESLYPNNGTNIANALNCAHEWISTWDKDSQYTLVHVLVISDGLSNVEEAKTAANLLLEDRISIHVMLIDPSPEGIDLAQAIKRGGKVTPVTSRSELKSAVMEETQSLSREAKRELAQPTLIGTLATILPLVLAIITIISILFGIFSQIRPERRLFQSSILFGGPLILLGGYFIYRSRETVGEQEIYINRNSTSKFPIYKWDEKQRKKFLIVGMIIIILGVGIILLGSIKAPDSPFLETPNPTHTISPSNTLTPIPTITPNKIPTSTSVPI